MPCVGAFVAGVFVGILVMVVAIAIVTRFAGGDHSAR